MAYGYDELADAFADTPSFTNGTPARRRRTVGAGPRDYGRGWSYGPSRRGQRWGRREQETCRGCGRELEGRRGGAEVAFPLSPTRTPGSRFADEFDDFDEAELDALIDAAIRPLSPWPRLLRQAQAAIRRALAAYQAGNRQAMTNAIRHANSLLQQARREVSRVMSGQRATQVGSMISDAYWRLASAQEAATTGRSIYGPGRSLLGADVHLSAALSAVQAAVQAVGLESI